jgi:NADH dehydrogenase
MNNRSLAPASASASASATPSRAGTRPKVNRPPLPRVLILGGGFAGLAAALALSPERHRVTLVHRQRDFEFLPNIHELVSGVKQPALLQLPLPELMQRAGHRFIDDTVSTIDPASRRAGTQERSRVLAHDALIVALGGDEAGRSVPGVAEHALGFRSVAQCLAIAQRLDRLAARHRDAIVTIVGAGIVGIEALGEMLRRHRTHPRLRFRVVEARQRLLPEAPSALDAHLRNLCAPWPVEFEIGTPVRRIRAAAVEMVDGRVLPSDLTLWAAGPTAPALLAQAGLAMPGAWAPVRDTLQSTLHDHVLIAGDAAGLAVPLAKQAYHAIDMGRHAAGNVERLLAGRPLQPFCPLPRPVLIAFGDLDCFLVAGSRVLAGAALAAGKEAVFELVMAQLDAQPWGQRLPRIGERSQRAARSLLWPTLTSPLAWWRQAQVKLL